MNPYRVYMLMQGDYAYVGSATQHSRGATKGVRTWYEMIGVKVREKRDQLAGGRFDHYAPLFDGGDPQLVWLTDEFCTDRNTSHEVEQAFIEQVHSADWIVVNRQRARVQHGTHAGYVELKCRFECPASPSCSEARSAYRREWAGRWGE